VLLSILTGGIKVQTLGEWATIPSEGRTRTLYNWLVGD
jgi:hypothetical protein